MLLRSVRRKKKPAAGQVWRCNDPRGWSGGSGGHHYVVLLANAGSGTWRVAVVETSPPNPLIEVHEPRIGVYGGIRLPTALLSESKLRDFKGNLGAVRAATYDEQLGAAEALGAASDDEGEQEEQATPQLPAAGEGPANTSSPESESAE